MHDIARRSECTTRFDLSRSHALDRLIVDEEAAIETWYRLRDRSHPAIESLRAAAWRSFTRIRRQRRGLEHEWAIPR